MSDNLNTLTPAQIDYCYQLIDKKHPLRKLPLVVVWPWLRFVCCCISKRKKNFKFALKKAIRSKLDEPLSRHEIELQQDPMLKLGFGMNAYFQIIKAMFNLMFWVCLANAPLLFIYSSYNTFPTMPLASLSLGNMGGAVTLCQQVPRHIQNLSLQLECPSGFLDPDATTK